MKNTPDELVSVAVTDLRVGDLVDLEYCPYLWRNPAAQELYGTVCSVVRETPKCVRVSYEEPFDAVGYPVRTKLRVWKKRAGVKTESVHGATPPSGRQPRRPKLSTTLRRLARDLRHTDPANAAAILQDSAGKVDVLLLALKTIARDANTASRIHGVNGATSTLAALAVIAETSLAEAAKP